MANSDSGNIHAGHRERLRQEFIASDGSAFNEIRMLELLLTYAIPKGDVNPLAHRLMSYFGSLRRIFTASVNELKSVQGVGDYTAVLIRLVSEINAKAFESEINSGEIIITGTEKAAEVIVPYFSHTSNEQFMVFFLDAGNKLISSSVLNRGSVTSVHIDLRKLVSECLAKKCVSVIIAHNHPDGVCTPSQADIDLTERIGKTLSSIDIKLLDHIIVSGEEHLSFANAGLI